ncbi:hypothetical protein EET67_25065 [Pseudaminobacter arsenicus]|uniref:Uncharacterized protein n=1 Tax=Borborobacter arsenicus TaxID=1851146 RepID=A0A432UYZ9_9HYPH|nr:hypothetical protein [Pseudaminobacter arsenicus]RUM95125.1 hypothetical protein EET67_25065 [Pseudaminobacter arsenicus]
MRAVTAWALFGMVDWNSMLLRRECHYENGAFDVRRGAPRPTAPSRAIAKLAAGEAYDRPAIDRPGWWRADSQLSRPVRPLLLSGRGEMRVILQDCCKARRLAVISDDFRSADQPLPAPAWSSIYASPARPEEPTLRLECRYAEGGLLDLEAEGTIRIALPMLVLICSSTIAEAW